MTTRSSYVPLFPLGVFLLPGEQMPLHIFEPRYKQLFNEAEENGVFFGLPFEDHTRKLSLVSMCRLVETTKRYTTGERDVIIEAFEIDKLEKQDQKYAGKLYPGGQLGDMVQPRGKVPASLETLNLFADYVEQKFGRRPTYGSLHKYTLLEVAASISLTSEQKIKFLLIKGDGERMEYLNNIMRLLKFLLYQESKSEDGILLN